MNKLYIAFAMIAGFICSPLAAAENPIETTVDNVIKGQPLFSQEVATEIVTAYQKVVEAQDVLEMLDTATADYDLEVTRIALLKKALR